MREGHVGKWLAGLGALLLVLAGCTSSSEPAAAPRVEVQPIRIEVWHDLVCPWCRIGLHNLETALERWNGAPEEVVHRAFLLGPDVPPEGLPMQAYMLERFGGSERVRAANERVARTGAQYGLTFFDSMQVMPWTAPAHAVIAWAPAEKRAALVRAIHEAHFLQGRNIGDAETLGAVAAALGLDGAAARAAARDPDRLARVRAEAQSAGAAGVRGVPHIAIGNRTLRGAQPPAAILQALQEAAAAP